MNDPIKEAYGKRAPGTAYRERSQQFGLVPRRILSEEEKAARHREMWPECVCHTGGNRG